MTLAIVFWVVMMVWLAFAFLIGLPNTKVSVSDFVIWLLLCLLGWAVFGPAIHR